MSVQQLSGRHLNFIVFGLMQLNKTEAANMLSYRTFGELQSYCSREANDDPGELFNKLAELNARAYNNRYTDDHAEPIPQVFFPSATALSAGPFRGYLDEKRIFTPIPGFYRVLKLIDSYLYQCSEPATAETPLYRLLESVSTDLKVYVFEHTQTYIKAPWTLASWEE